MSHPYTGSLLFCRNTLFSSIKTCSQPVGASPNLNYSPTPERNIVVLPKKVRVFGSSDNTMIMTKSQLIRWASSHRYR